MRKKWHTLLPKVSDILFSRHFLSRKERFERAKELYFINFASHATMRKNGEYREYCRYRIPKETEHLWSLEVKDSLIDKILNGSDYLGVVQLANVNLPKEDILNSFKRLAQTPKKDIILSTIKKMSILFDPDVYSTIISFFN